MSFWPSSLARSSSWRPGLLFLGLYGAGLAGCAPVGTSPIAPIDKSAWRIEAESPEAAVRFEGGLIDIDTAKGLSLWYLPELAGPVTIRFEAMAVAEGGANDAVSDLNAFWMAANADGT